MSEVINYKKLALEWEPKPTVSDHFKWITLVVFLSVIVLAVVVAFIKVPAPERRFVTKVPDRIANFIAERPKKVIPVPPPESKPIVLPRKPQTQQLQPEQPARVTIERKRPSEANKKPLDETAKQAREVAQQSGLLALASEMSELTDTNDVSSSVRAKLRTNTATAPAASHDTIKIESTASNNTVDAEKITANSNKAKLEERDSGKQITATTEQAEKESIATTNTTSQAGGRAPEDLTRVFDKNRSSLYSLYERERRKNSTLKGRVVFQLTILPNGKVAAVKVVSSDLNNPALEARIMSRIKLFTFPPTSGAPVTVSYPIEFLP